MCRVLEVSTSGYYAWRKRPASRRAQDDGVLLRQIRTIHAASRESYGVPRVYRELAEEGVSVGRDRVARLMRRAGLRGISRRRFVSTTQREKAARPAPDLVERRFEAPGPNQLWVADITYIPTWAGFLYLAIVLDVFSRRVVGWAMEGHLRTELVLAALQMATSQRRPASVIHHSDQGCSTLRSPSGSAVSSSGCGLRWAASATPTTTRWRRASSQPSSASCSTARVSRRSGRRSSPCSSGSRAGTTRTGGTPRSVLCLRRSSNAVTRSGGPGGSAPRPPVYTRSFRGPGGAWSRKRSTVHGTQVTPGPPPPGGSLGLAIPSGTTRPLEEAQVLETIAIVLIILWLAGLVTSHTMGGLVHILLVIALVVIVVRVIQGRRPLG
jgi:putative transposase